MAIRMRRVGDRMIALCAAETDEMTDDIYLDDGLHYALAAKFASDWRGQTIDFEYTEEWALMETQKLRDARETLNKWIDEQEQDSPPAPNSV